MAPQVWFLSDMVQCASVQEQENDDRITGNPGYHRWNMPAAGDHGLPGQVEDLLG